MAVGAGGGAGDVDHFGHKDRDVGVELGQPIVDLLVIIGDEVDGACAGQCQECQRREKAQAWNSQPRHLPLQTGVAE